MIRDLPQQPTERALRDPNIKIPEAKDTPRRYGVLFYETFAAAKADRERIASSAQEFDQLNIVIRAEGNMDDPDLSGISKAKVFAGAAWHLIHERRQTDGWYTTPR